MKNRRKGISSTSPKATARLALAALLAAALALPLTGCFGIPDPDEIAGKAEEAASQAEELASQAQELAGTLSSVEWGKVSRLVVKDASSGEIMREVTDQGEIEQAFAPPLGRERPRLGARRARRIYLRALGARDDKSRAGRQRRQGVQGPRGDHLRGLARRDARDEPHWAQAPHLLAGGGRLVARPCRIGSLGTISQHARLCHLIRIVAHE